MLPESCRVAFLRELYLSCSLLELSESAQGTTISSAPVLNSCRIPDCEPDHNQRLPTRSNA